MRPFPEVAGVEVEHRFVDAGGLRMHVAECGGGEPLVLLHGWPQHWWMWRGVLPALSERFRCIVPDLRGLGWTDAPATGYDKPQLAADVLALLDALGLQKVRLMGHDWGAFTSLVLCREAPGRIERCISLDVPLPWDPSLDPRRLLGISHMPFLSAPFAERAVPAIASQILRASRMGPEARGEFVDSLRAPERRRATVGYYRTFLLHELPEVLTSRPEPPDVELLALGGAGDPIVRWSSGIEKIPGAGHFLPDDRPDAVVERALAFR